MRYKLFVIAVFSLQSSVAQLTAPTPYLSGLKLSYVRSWDASAPLQNIDSLKAKTVSAAKQTTVYFDGFGRTIQTVQKQFSPNHKDMVASNVYDGYGREVQQYLPYEAIATAAGTDVTDDGNFKLNAFQQQSKFSQNQYPGETFFYGKTGFEPSPLNKVLESFAPGDNWVGTESDADVTHHHSVRVQYLSNSNSDSVRIWEVNASASGAYGSVNGEIFTYTTSAIYSEGQLYKTVTYDEHAKQVVEFKDKEGKIILKKVQLSDIVTDSHTGWLCTYYVYDIYNNLRLVIPPKAVELVYANSWSLTFDSHLINELCFIYYYDNRNRMIIKKNPGAGNVSMVYDILDRVVMTQDSNMMAQNKWLITEYDNLGRSVRTGLWTNPRSRSSHQGAAKSAVKYPVSDSLNSNYELLTEAYYDNYDWTSSSGGVCSNSRVTTYDGNFLTPNNTAFPYPQSLTQGYQTRGMVTGGKVKVLGSSSQYLYNGIYYDDKGKSIQTQSNNISGGTDIISIQYSWSGQPLLTIAKHEKAGTNSQTSIVLTKPTYDDVWRVTKTEKKISNTKVNSGSMPGSWTTENQNEYNALGQLKKRKLGTTPLDSLNYDYNIRGWMLGMNRVYVKDTTSTANYFGFDLGYDKTSFTVNGISLSYTAAQYNGNINGMLWRSTGDDMLRKYDFTYDAANRFLSADFNQLNSNSFNKTAKMDFSVQSMSYDANGNILNMNQKGWKLGGSVTIDSLAYGYISNSNRLNYVTDRANDASSKLGDFKETTNNTSSDYTYDANGSLISDNNKAISSIVYNYLNLPDSLIVTGKGSIKYIYDAAGNKLKKMVREGSTVTSTLYLMGNYVNDTLQFIGTEEGRARVKSDSSVIVYDYMLKDHLGNVHMVLTEQKDTAVYPKVSFESATIATEQIYYQNANIAKTGRPGSFYNSTDNGDTVQLLRSSTTRIGVGQLLKVMAGDRMHVKVDYYITNDATDNASPNGLNSILTALSGLIDNSIVTSSLHGGGSSLTSDLNSNTPFTDFLATQGTGSSSSMPKAYLNIIFFDEHFNFVSSNSEIIQVDTKGSGQTITRISGSAKEALKNGYVYIFVSNESNNLVYFDNLQVTHEKGAILEETHYYPFGLTMAGISSKAAGGIENKLKYNGKELQSEEFADGGGMEEYDYGARHYNAQIGRFMTVDRFSEKYESFSPYSYTANNPISYIDVNGDSIWTTIGNTQYYFGNHDGKWGLYDQSGSMYSGDNKWANQLVSSLTEIANLRDDVISERFNDVLSSSYKHTINETKAGDNQWSDNDKNGKINNGGNVFWDGLNTYNSIDNRLEYASEKLVHELLGHGWQGQNGLADFSQIDSKHKLAGFYDQDSKIFTWLTSSSVTGLTKIEVDATSVQNRYLGAYSLKPVAYYPQRHLNQEVQKLPPGTKYQQPLILYFPAGVNEFLKAKKN